MPKKFCNQCGSKLVSSSRFCSECGTLIQNGTTKSIPKEPTFKYPATERHSEIITKDDKNGQPVILFRNLHPNAVWLFVMQYIGKTSVILILLLIAAYFEPYISIGAIAGYFIILYLAALINYKNYKFEITAVSFRKVHGVFHKYTVNIAFDQIQNINKRRSIIDQLLGLAHLDIETAATGGLVERNVGGLLTVSEGYIPGITPKEAEDIMQLMLARIQND